MNEFMNLLYITSLVMFWAIPLLCWLLFDKKDEITAKLWLAGMISYSIIVSVFCLAKWLPTWAVNLTLVSSTITVLFFTEAMKLEYQQTKIKWRTYAVFVAIGIGIDIALISTDLHYSIGIPLFLIIVIILEFILIYHMAKVTRMYKSKSLLILLTFIGLVALANFARVINQFTGHTSGPVTDNSAVSNIAFVIYLISVIFYGFGYVIFIAEKTKFRLHKALEGERIATEHEQSAVALLKERDTLIKRITLLQKNAQTSALSSTIAHEINQPLAVIKLEAQYALSQLERSNPERLKNLLEKIVSNIDRSAQIIRTIRTIFNESSDSLEQRSLNQVIRAVCELLTPQAENFEIQLRLKLDTSDSINARTSELELVFINLINNAIDSLKQASDKHKVIEIHAYTMADKVFITIADNGIGISVEQTNHLFDLMQTTKKHGSGIGLWLSRFIVERFGGKIYLKEPSKRGATFIVEISK